MKAHTDIPRTAEELTGTVCADIIHRVLNDGPVEVPLRSGVDVSPARMRIHKAALAQIEPIEIATKITNKEQMLIVSKYSA